MMKENRFDGDTVRPAAKYPMSEETSKDLLQRFTYHPPQEGQPVRYELIRGKAHELACQIVTMTPKSREQSLALTHLETAVMWANAAIARRE